MANPRERSRHRGRERQKEHEMQNLQTSHRSPTAEGSTAHIENSYVDRNHGHPQNQGAQRLDRRSLRMYTEGLAGALRTCKERSVEILWVCKEGSEGLAKHRRTAILTASIICLFFVYGLWALRGLGLGLGAESSDYGLARSTRTVYDSSTRYITYTVRDKQFYGARPVHHQAPMPIPTNIEATGQVTRQDLSQPHVVTASAPVSGLYYIPMSFTTQGWPRPQQDSHPSSHSASTIEALQNMQGRPSSLNSKAEAKLLLQSHGIDAPRDLLASHADADTTSFARFGVEVLYDLRHHSRRSFPLYKGWCIKNACSPYKQLSSMCNTNKTISNTFKKKECEWCWPENQRKYQEINDHCTEVSKRALHTMFIICGMFLFCTIVIAMFLSPRMLQRRRRAKADRIFHKQATTASSLQDKINSAPSRWFPQGMPRFGRSSKGAETRVGDISIGKSAPGEAFGETPWYKAMFTRPGKRSEINPENPAPGRLRLQKHRTEPLEQEFAIGDGNSDGRVLVLPPAPPTISSRVFSDIENMGQGRFLSSLGIGNSHHESQETPRRFSRKSRAVSSGSEQSSSGAMHRQNAGIGLYNLQRLTERS